MNKISVMLEFLVILHELKSTEDIQISLRKVIRSYGFSYHSLFNREVLESEIRWQPVLRHFEHGPNEPAKPEFNGALNAGWAALEIAREPFYWHDLIEATQGNANTKRRIQRHLSRASEMDITHGVTFPIYAKNGLSGVLLMASDRQIELSPVEFALFETLSTSLLRHCRRILQRDIASDDQMRSVPELSGRELEILQNLAEGMTSVETGKTMELSNHTVDWYVSNLQEKLGARNRQNLIAMAFRLGLVK